MLDRLLPSWLLLVLAAATCGWSYFRFEVLVPSLHDLLDDPAQYAGRELVIGHVRVIEIESGRLRFQYRGKIYSARGDLPPGLIGGLCTLRCRLRPDGQFEILDSLSHHGRGAKVWTSAVGAILLALLCARWFRWNRSHRWFEIADDA